VANNRLAFELHTPSELPDLDIKQNLNGKYIRLCGLYIARYHQRQNEQETPIRLLLGLRDSHTLSALSEGIHCMLFVSKRINGFTTAILYSTTLHPQFTDRIAYLEYFLQNALPYESTFYSEGQIFEHLDTFYTKKSSLLLAYTFPYAPEALYISLRDPVEDEVSKK
jgi:hypothetical protein